MDEARGAVGAAATLDYGWSRVWYGRRSREQAEQQAAGFST